MVKYCSHSITPVTVILQGLMHECLIAAVLCYSVRCALRGRGHARAYCVSDTAKDFLYPAYLCLVLKKDGCIEVRNLQMSQTKFARSPWFAA